MILDCNDVLALPYDSRSIMAVLQSYVLLFVVEFCALS